MRRLLQVAFALLACPRVGSARDAARVYSRSKPAIVTVRTDVANGTGFIVGDGSTVLTCYHVVEDAGSIRVEGAVNSSAVVVGFDASRDVAMLRIGRRSKSCLEVRGAAPGPGKKIYAIGTALGILDNSITEGIVSGHRVVRNVLLLQITAPISHGDSGGPVLDDDGRVVGMVQSSIVEGQGLNFAVSGLEILRAMSSIRSKRAAAASTPTAKVAFNRGKKVIGRLARALKDTCVYAAPSEHSTVLSQVDKGLYIVWRPKNAKWSQVVLQNGRTAYVRSKDIEVLPYDVTAPTEGGTTRQRVLGDVESGVGNELAQAAVEAKGSPYRAKGTSLETGVGSGEFVAVVFSSKGFALSNVPDEQASRGVAIKKLESLIPGDRLYFWGEKAGKIDEAGIYVGGGYVAMADSRKGRVVVTFLSEALRKRLVAARRGAPMSRPTENQR